MRRGAAWGSRGGKGGVGKKRRAGQFRQNVADGNGGRYRAGAQREWRAVPGGRGSSGHRDRVGRHRAGAGTYGWFAAGSGGSAGRQSRTDFQTSQMEGTA